MSNMIAIRRRNRKDGEYSAHFTERHWAISGIVLSTCILAGKLFVMYGDSIHRSLVDTKLVRLEQVADNGALMFKYVYQNSIRYSKIWLPLFCGIIATYFTWITVYLDSDVPGIHPPSPLSPKMLKKASGHAFHLNYLFALIIGSVLTVYMYLLGVELQL